MARALRLFIGIAPVVHALPAALRGGPSLSVPFDERGEFTGQLGQHGGYRSTSRSTTREEGSEDSVSAASIADGRVSEHEHRRGLVEDPEGGSFEYVGCYKDDPDDRVLSSKIASDEMTPMMCHRHCDGMGAAYMAVEFGTECWCSLEGSLNYDKNGEGSCDMPCEGNEFQMCGGERSFDLYKLEWADASTDEEYLGCFRDLEAFRLMSEMIQDDEMTPALCRDHCELNYNIFYGLEFGNECWCGKSSWLSDYDLLGEGVCHMECAGDETVACGGYQAFSLFRILVEGVDDDDRPDNDDVTPSPVDYLSSYDDPTDDSDRGPEVLGYTGAAASRGGIGPAPTIPAPAPIPAPSPGETSQSTSLGQSSDGLDDDSLGYDSGEFGELLDLHNKARCVHDAEPLEWNHAIADDAQKHAYFLSDADNCGLLIESDSAYGENMFLCGTSSDYGCYSAAFAIQTLYDNELTQAVKTYGKGATQILWQSTNEVGCGFSQCRDSLYYYEILVCHYNPPGNNPDELDENVELPTRSRGSCGLP